MKRLPDAPLDEPEAVNVASVVTADGECGVGIQVGRQRVLMTPDEARALAVAFLFAAERAELSETASATSLALVN